MLKKLLVLFVLGGISVTAQARHGKECSVDYSPKHTRGDVGVILEYATDDQRNSLESLREEVKQTRAQLHQVRHGEDSDASQGSIPDLNAKLQTLMEQIDDQASAVFDKHPAAQTAVEERHSLIRLTRYLMHNPEAVKRVDELSRGFGDNFMSRREQLIEIRRSMRSARKDDDYSGIPAMKQQITEVFKAQTQHVQAALASEPGLRADFEAKMRDKKTHRGHGEKKHHQRD